MIANSVQIAVKALGVDPDKWMAELYKVDQTKSGDKFGVTKEPCECSFCGDNIPKGNLVALKCIKNNSGFTNDIDLINGDNVACKYCAVFLGMTELRIGGNKIYSEAGAFNIKPDNDRGHFLLNPPKPPWVAVITNKSMFAQHLIWLTPPTIDNNLMVFRLGKQILKIPRKRLLKSIKLCGQASRIIEKSGLTRKGKTFTHPYIRIDRDLDNLSHGQFLGVALKVAKTDEKMAEILAYLAENPLGVTWALATLVKAKALEEVSPQPVTL